MTGVLTCLSVDGNPDLLIGGDSGLNIVLDFPTEVVQASTLAITLSSGSHQIQATSNFGTQHYGSSSSSSITVQGPQ